MNSKVLVPAVFSSLISLSKLDRNRHQMVEGACPAVPMRERRLGCGKPRVDEGHIGLAVTLVQNRGDLLLHLGLEIIVLLALGENEAAVFFDLEIFSAMTSVVLADFLSRT